MSKKIVILALHLDTGGAEKVICNLANLLAENNDVKIISTYKINETPSFNIGKKIKIEYLMNHLKPIKNELKKSLKNFQFILAIKQIINNLKVLYLRKHLMIQAIKKLDCDIVISTRILHSNWVGKFANENIIKIAQEHNHHNGNQKYINKVIKSLKNFDYFMPVSKELTEFYKTRVKNTKVIYIPNFIEKIPTEKSSLQNKQLISVGRLDKIKGFDILIDIFNIFQDSHPDWVLHIIGDGPERQNLQNKINQLNLQNKVSLCGTKLSKELEKEYLNSSLYLMTSFSESFGLVLVEAASFGLPSIAFDSAKGAAEIIENDKTGFLIPNRNIDIFLEKLNELVENSEKQKIFAKNSLLIAKTFSKCNISELWNNFLNSI